MKNWKFLTLLIPVVVFISFSGCKKGPDDPFFSIHSRLGRVTGNWNVSSWMINGKTQLRVVIDSVTFQGPCGQETDKAVNTYTVEWDFDKIGNWKETRATDSTVTADIVNNTSTCVDASASSSYNVVSVANWNFADGVGDLKNKEQLYIIDNETKLVRVYEIVECRNNTMHLQQELIDPVSNTVEEEDVILDRIK